MESLGQWLPLCHATTFGPWLEPESGSKYGGATEKHEIKKEPFEGDKQHIQTHPNLIIHRKTKKHIPTICVYIYIYSIYIYIYSIYIYIYMDIYTYIIAVSTELTLKICYVSDVPLTCFCPTRRP